MQHIQDINRKRNIMALVASIIVIVAFFVSVILQGGYVLHYFTTWSNVIAATAAFLTIPYEIDGLRKNNFHFPNWIVVLVYIGSTGLLFVFLFIAIFGIWVDGLANSFGSQAFFQHLICPLTSVLLSLYLIKDHKLAFKDTFLAIIPISLYCAFYFVSVVVLKVMDDIYYLNTAVPFWFSFVVLEPCVYGIACLIRYVHNKNYTKEKERVANYYLECAEFNQKDIISAVEQMAADAALHDHGGDVVVPRRIIALMKDKYQCSQNIDELCDCFQTKYFSCINERKQD